MASKLKDKKNKKPENPGKETMALFLQYSVIMLTVLIVTILPLALKDGYYKIGEFKFKVYGYLMAGGIVILVPMLILYAVFCRKEISLKKIWEDFSLTDKFVMAYFITTLISFFANPKYMKDNFIGYPGWYMGLYAQFTFVFLYFVLSRFAKDYVITLAFLASTSFLAYVFGILHRMLIDPLGTYEGISPIYYNFLSTLGQSSWYSSFLCTFLPLMMGVYLVVDKRWLRIISGIFCMTGFTTLVSQSSDSAYFAIVGTFLVLVFIAVRKAEWMRHLVELAWGVFVAGKIMQLLLTISPNEYLFVEWGQVRLDKISLFLITDNRSWLCVIMMTIIWIVFLLIEKKRAYTDNTVKVMTILRNILYAAVLILLMTVTAVLVLEANGKLSQQMMDMLEKIPYMIWNEEWGNGRGFTWSVTLKMIREFRPLKLLLGVGPDGYAKYGYEFYQEIIRAKWGDNVLTNAHNEWINMIVDGGLLGGVAYAGIYLSSLFRSVKAAEKLPVLVASAACVSSYMFHNLFCYQQVLCTPFIFMLMAFAEYKMRSERG